LSIKSCRSCSTSSCFLLFVIRFFTAFQGFVRVSMRLNVHHLPLKMSNKKTAEAGLVSLFIL
jgi:hypothetical protein